MDCNFWQYYLYNGVRFFAAGYLILFTLLHTYREEERNKSKPYLCSLMAVAQ